MTIDVTAIDGSTQTRCVQCTRPIIVEDSLALQNRLTGSVFPLCSLSCVIEYAWTCGARQPQADKTIVVSGDEEPTASDRARETAEFHRILADET